MEYTLTEASRNNSSRGLALAKKYNRELPESIIKQAKNLTDELSLDQVKELYKELSKLEKSYKPKNRLEDSGLDTSTLSYLSLGGTSALANARLILREENILKSFTQEITELELNSEDNLPNLNISITKAVNEELQQATFVVMVPDEVDLHGDITSEAEVRKACTSFVKHANRANLFHLVETDTFEFIENYISPVDFVLGERFVKKGTWLCTIQCLDDGLWSLIKSGKICSVSIGAVAKVENLEDD